MISLCDNWVVYSLRSMTDQSVIYFKYLIIVIEGFRVVFHFSIGCSQALKYDYQAWRVLFEMLPPDFKSLKFHL